METSNMKNMVVLKNLPSNLVEEAIVILKSSKKVKKLEKIEKNRKVSKAEPVKKEKDYILKEAEMLISNYISKNQKEEQLKKKKYNKKYVRLKRYAYSASVVIVIQAILLIVR